MPPLDRKLLRDIWRLKTQALAIAAVIGAGVGIFTMMNGAIRSLEETRLTYYERYRFADIWAPAKRVPEFRMAAIREVPGIAVAESRIQVAVLVDLPGVSAPISGKVISLPAFGRPLLNALYVTAGRYPERGRPREIMLLDSFAAAHGLRPGHRLSANVNGIKRRLLISGLVKSPEFVYSIPPGELIPDHGRYAVMWMGREAIGNAFDLDGAFNEVVAQLERGANERAVMERLDRLLDRYGGIGAYSRENQLSDEFVRSEIQQLSTVRWVIPPIFLLVAAFLLNVVTTRLVETEREQIGLLKAFGYRPPAIGAHYLKMVMLIAMLGIAGGLWAGHSMGSGLAKIYASYYDFPLFVFRAGADVYATAALIGLLAAAIGAINAVRQAIALDPAVAMRPRAPAGYRLGPLMASLQGYMDQPTRMIFRNLTRYPRRTALTGLGLALAVAIRVLAGSMPGATDAMIELYYNYASREDILVSFVEPIGEEVLYELSGLPGVIRAEPMRIVPAMLSHGPRVRRQGITGIASDMELNRLIDAEREAVPMPESGLMLSSKLAETLGVSRGESLTIKALEGRRVSAQVPVAGLVESYIGTPAYMHIDALNALLDESPRLSGVFLLTDRRKQNALYDALKNRPKVAGVAIQNTAEQNFKTMMDETIGVTNLFNTLFASLIAVGIVYNAARISLSERARELASLRVIGFGRAEVSYILLGELAVITVLALPVGFGLGTLMQIYLIAQFDTELFQVPLIFTPSVYGTAALTVLIAAALSGLLVRGRIDRFDLVSVLKTRE